MSVNIETKNGLVRVSDMSIHQSTGAAEGDVLPQHVLEGKTFSSSAGKNLVGTMPNNGKMMIPGTIFGEIRIPYGFHDGTGYVDTTSLNSIINNKIITLDLNDTVSKTQNTAESTTTVTLTSTLTGSLKIQLYFNNNVLNAKIIENNGKISVSGNVFVQTDYPLEHGVRGTVTQNQNMNNPNISID